MPMEVRMVKMVKYKIRDKAELDDGIIKHDMLGNIPELQVPEDGNIDDDDSPSARVRENVPNTVVGGQNANDDILEPLDVVIETTSSPAKFSVRGLNVRQKKNLKGNMMEMFIMQMQSDTSARKHEAE